MKQTVEIYKRGEYSSPGEFYVLFLAFKQELYMELVKIGAYKIDTLKGQYLLFCFFSIDYLGCTKIYRIESSKIDRDWNGSMKITEVKGYYEYETGKEKVLYLDNSFINDITKFLNI